MTSYPPPYAQPASTAMEPRKGCSCLPALAIGCGALLCLLLLVGMGIYLFFMQGTVIPGNLLNLVGMGQGEISIVNLSQSERQSRLVYLDGEQGSEEVGRRSLGEFGSDGFGSLKPGAYELIFLIPGEEIASGLCRLTIVSGDLYQFIILEPGILVSNERYPPNAAMDLKIESSPLCQ